LSSEQTSRRMRIVSSSTSASDTNVTAITGPVDARSGHRRPGGPVQEGAARPCEEYIHADSGRQHGGADPSPAWLRHRTAVRTESGSEMASTSAPVVVSCLTRVATSAWAIIPASRPLASTTGIRRTCRSAMCATAWLTSSSSADLGIAGHGVSHRRAVHSPSATTFRTMSRS
jgi:hypothetical protein